MKKLVNTLIFWGGLGAYSVYFSKAHPNAGFFSSLFDPWSFVVLIGLWITQAVVNRVYFKGVIDVSEADLTVMANEMNKECPKELDQWTRLDGGIAGPGLKFTNKFTLTTVETLPAEEALRLKGQLTKTISAQWTPENAATPVYNAGVEFVYEYRGKGGDVLFTITQKKVG